MRSAAPTAAMQRQLADLLNPKPTARPKRVGNMPAAGVRGYSTGCIVLPVMPGATLAAQMNEWERIASAHCAKLMEASKEDAQ